MIEVSVTPASGADRDELDRLEAIARSGLDGQRGGAQHLADGGPWRLADRVDALNAAVILGRLDGVPVAFVCVAERPTGSAMIEALFVERDAREIGIGEVLAAAAIAWARQRGATAIAAIALPGDRATKNFFETFGLVARAIVVHRDLRVRDI